MKVKQPQHVRPSGFFQAIDDFQQLRRRQAELCGFTARFFPAARSFRIQLDAHANHRQVAFRGFGDAQDMVQLAQFLDDDDHALA